jgi:hypothetical protein
VPDESHGRRTFHPPLRDLVRRPSPPRHSVTSWLASKARPSSRRRGLRSPADGGGEVNVPFRKVRNGRLPCRGNFPRGSGNTSGYANGASSRLVIPFPEPPTQFSATMTAAIVPLAQS